MNTTTRDSVVVTPDFDLLAQYDNDPSYGGERAIVSLASKAPKMIGKIIYGLFYYQALIWKMDERLARKMSVVYLTAREYLIKSGIPEELANITAILFDELGGKPLKEPLRRSVRFICVGWHARMTRAFHLIRNEFEDGKNVTSYGCGSGIIELLALIASKNKMAQLYLIDKDPANIVLAQELLGLFIEHGHDVRSQVTIILGDIKNHKMPNGTNTVVSIGLLLNYYSLETAIAIMQEWFGVGATKVIADIYYDPKTVAGGDAQVRIDFIQRVLDWKIGPPDGLLYCSMEELAVSLPNNRIDFYDHGLGATLVVS